MDKKWKYCIISGFVLVVIVVAVVLSLTLRPETSTSVRPESEGDKFEQEFIARCEKFKGYDCRTIWDKFRKTYVGRNPCHVSMDAYDPVIAVAPFNHACSSTMLWSQTKDVVHDFSKKKDCFFTLEETLLGSVLDDLTWCGKEGSSDTFTSGCPNRNDCENNPRRSFWRRASAAFADHACGTVTAMLSGSIAAPFDPTSIFGSIEVKGLKSTTVRKLSVVLVTQKNPVANCNDASLQDLQTVLAEGITYSCTEVTESQIQECSSDSEKPCGPCW